MTTTHWVVALVSIATVGPVWPADEIIDDFADGGWAQSNRRAPGEVTMAKGKLVLQDQPGGEVTWGTSAAKRFRDIDITATPYVVFDVAKMTNGFAVKLAGGKQWPKKSVAMSDEPGLVVVDISRRTGWKPGKGDLTVMIYTRGDGTSIELRSVKITGQLTSEEKEALKRIPKATAKVVRQSGLTALAARRGMKPFAIDPKDGERTVYVDPATGHTVWRMTDHPAIERHVYYDILAWNANGGLIYFLSRRAGANQWLMDADGTNIRPMPTTVDGEVVGRPHWSPTRPDIMYYPRPEDDCVRVMAFNVRDRSAKEVVAVPIGKSAGNRTFSEFCPPHPDERHFLLRWGGQDRHATMLVVVDSKTGKHWVMEPGIPTHRVRFTKSSDLSVFVNSNQDPDKPGVRARTEWLLTLDGAKRRLPPGGGHPDWTPDGSWLGAYRDGGIFLISHDGETVKQLVKTGSGGHGGFSITTGAYHVGDSPGGGLYPNLVYVTAMATGHVFPIAYHGSSYSGWSSGVPDPEATHPAPICSPDETKIIYDSDMLGQPDVWVAVWKRPGVPREATFTDGTLSWRAPTLHREIAGYNVYRKQDGRWDPVQTLVDDTRIAGLEDGQYAVAAQEHSGLESNYVMAGSNSQTTDTFSPARPARPQTGVPEATHIEIRWAASPEPGLDHYNVYSSPDPNTGALLATLVGSPKETRFMDWGLRPGTTYHYRITTVDRQGNESLPSFAAMAATPELPGGRVWIEIELEEGEIEAPMAVAKGRDASAGAYVHVPEETSDEPYVLEGKITIGFEIPHDGTYDFWGRAMGPDGSSNSVFASIDGSPQVIWNVRTSRRGPPRFFWERVSGFECVPLKGGRHVLVIASREDGTRVDKLVITNDPQATFDE